MAKAPKKLQIDSDVSQQEAEEARDAILKRMLSTPPKPLKSGAGRGKGRGKKG